MDVDSRQYIQSFIEGNKSTEWQIFEKQILEFFSFCFRNKKSLSEDDRQRLSFHSAMISFAVGSRLMSNRLSSKKMRTDLAHLKSAKKSLSNISDSNWHENIDDRSLYEGIYSHLDKALGHITSAIQYAEAMPTIPSGRPNHLNLEILISKIAELFIFELYRRYNSDSKGILPKVDAINENYEASLKTTRTVDHLIIKLVSNYLEAGTKFRGISGITIYEVIRKSTDQKIDDLTPLEGNEEDQIFIGPQFCH